MILHENDNYFVEFDDNEDESPYLVINKQTDFPDAKLTNLPQALVVSEQLNNILTSKEYETMFNKDAVGFFFEEEEDSYNH